MSLEDAPRDGQEALPTQDRKEDTDSYLASVTEERDAREAARVRAKAEAEAAALARREARARDKAQAHAGRKRSVDPDDDRPSGRAAARAPATVAARPSGSRARIIALVLFATLMVTVGAIHVVPIDPVPYEKAATERIGQPVRIGSVNIALVPRPQITFSQISIGTGPDRSMKIASAHASLEMSGIFAERKIVRNIELVGLVLPQSFAAAALWSKGDSGALRIERVTAAKVKLEFGGVALPPLDLDVSLSSEGGISLVTLANDEQKLQVKIEPNGAKAKIEMAAKSLALPFGTVFKLDEFSGKGVLSAGDMTLSEFEARAFDGYVSGNARLRWGAAWSLDGEVAGRQIDAAALIGAALRGGRLEGKGSYVMRAATADKLFPTARIEGSASVQKGAIANVDMKQILQGAASAGGATPFSELGGGFVADARGVQVRQLRMSAGLLSGNGSVEADAQGNLSGKMQLELKSQAVQGRAGLTLSGTLKEPQYRRSN